MESKKAMTKTGRVKWPANTRFVALSAVIGMVVLVGNAIAGPNNLPDAAEILTCDLRSKIIADLQKGYEEHPTAQGVTNAGTVMELWTGHEGDTWTLIVSLTDGRSCVVGAGESWSTIRQSARGKLL